MRINILTSSDSEFVDSAQELKNQFNDFGHASAVYTDHKKMGSGDVLFILSYFKILSQDELAKHNNNLVIHASDLPLGKGFSPIAWQIIEGMNSITFSLFEATEALDAGPVYFKRTLDLDGTELYHEWKALQNQQVMSMACEFVRQLPNVLNKARLQTGKETIYRRRHRGDDQLDLNKPLSSQINILRICNPDKFPAWFEYKGRNFKISLEPLD